MRVITLLPAATEIVAALGAGDRLVGISHECDYPPDLHHLPRVTASRVDPHAPGGVIDASVRALLAEGRPVIAVDGAALERLRPDLIITQALCDVCAVSDGQVHQLTATLHPAPRVLSLGARDLAGIWADIRAVGAALDLTREADALIREREGRLASMAPSRAGRTSQAFGIPRVLCVEWLDPLYLAGHWVPELVMAAGGEDAGAEPGAASTRRSWAEAARLRPDLIVVMLCGFDVSRSGDELAALTDPIALTLFGSTPTWILDGNAYTSRPGPRVVEGAEQIRAAMRGEEMQGMKKY
jgi:iron complex transport system substrate-binding protein